MTRQWTIEELDRVHPLPDGWVWRMNNRTPCAEATVSSDTWDAGDLVMIYGEGTGLGACVQRVDRDCDVWPAPVDIALAVLLASKGLDSTAHLVKCLRAERERCRAKLDEETTAYNHARYEGRIHATEIVLRMLGAEIKP